ncbi:MAG TPA: hypothetical protein VGE00_02065 [Gammaproteobacteria bacterium]
MGESAIPEEYVSLVQALADDGQLREWLVSLAAQPHNRRYSELGRVAAQFREVGEEPLARVILSLNDERIFKMVLAVIRLTASRYNDSERHSTNG